MLQHITFMSAKRTCSQEKLKPPVSDPSSAIPILVEYFWKVHGDTRTIPEKSKTIHALRRKRHPQKIPKLKSDASKWCIKRLNKRALPQSAFQYIQMQFV